MTAPIPYAPEQQPTPQRRALTDPPAVEPLAPPPPPLAKVRGEGYPDQQAPEGDKIRWVEQLVATTDADALQRARKTAYNLLMANGRQHVTWNARQKRYEEMPHDPNEIRVTMNYIRPVLRSRTRRLLPTRIDYQFVPDSTAADARDQAVVGQRFAEARWMQLAMRAKVDQALELSYASGVSFLKSFWNPALGYPKAAQLYVEQPVVGEDGQPVVDEMGQPLTEPVLTYVDANAQPVETEDAAYQYRPGDTDVSVRSIFNVRWNPEAKGWTTADGLRWVIDQEPVPITYARYLFPEYADKIMPDGNADAYLTYEKLSQQAPASRSSSTNAYTTGNRPDGDVVMLREYWELPTPHFPKGRLITLAGKCVVYDGDFPQGFFPYTPVYDEPASLTAGGRASIDDMTGPQAVINEQWGAVLRASKLVGVGQYITVDAPGMPDLVSNIDGGITKLPQQALRGQPIGNVFTKLDQSSVPSDRWQIIQQAEKVLFNVGAYHEVTQGSTPPGVDSGVAVRALVEQEEGQLAKSRDALKESLIEFMRHQLALAVWGYEPGDERFLPVNRPDLGYQIESVDGAKLPNPERAYITLDGFRATSVAEQRAEVNEAVERGYLTPQEARRALELGRGLLGTADTESRHYARARQISLWIEQGALQMQPVVVDGVPVIDDATQQPLMQAVGPSGLPVVIPDVDRHDIHLDVLTDLILDESKPIPVRAMAQAVYQERLQIVKASAMPPAPPA